MPNQSIIDYRPFQTEGEGLDLSAFGKKRLLAENRQKVINSVRALSYMAAVVIPLFAILDFFMYPEHFVEFLMLRFVCVGCVLGALFMCAKTRFGKRFYRMFTVIIPLIPAFFIALMIFLSGDVHTTYYVGMVLCLVVIGFVSHWTCTEALIASALVILFYFVAIFPAIFSGVDTRGAIYLLSNCIFAVAYGAVITIGTYLHQRIRMNEFVSREKVRQQQIKLENKHNELARTMVELRDTEHQLIQSEKMASLGQLSAGVIHEIGNPLNYSNQAVFLLRKLLRSDNPNGRVIEAIDDIQDSIDRMKEIVRELREFSHKTGENNIEHSLADSVRVALRMLGKEIETSEMTVMTEVSEEIRIVGAKNQITQVLINLIHNAIQATGKVEQEQKNIIEIRASADDEQAFITVRDNGPGIEPENLSRIFDPFFTTKEVGHGTGLGLSICYRIVESHNGQITVDSNPGEFTEFLISLPLAQASAGTAPHHANPTLIKYGQEVF